MKRVGLFGATGTIGRATASALLDAGHDVVCFSRGTALDLPPDISGHAQLRVADIADPQSLATQAFAGPRFDAVISCMASRTGVPDDAWAVDYRANCNILHAAQAAGVAQFVLLSAICVQKPLLAFQHAKLAFEAKLVKSGLRYSIVRPTAFFKSLSGQVQRVAQGKPYLIFGDGKLTACKPISNADLGRYIVGCLDDRDRWDRILPIGGPGDAMTPLEQGELLFALTGRPPRYRSVPVGLLNAIARGLSAGGRIVPPLAKKAELAKIGHYYATESMLLLDPHTGRYSADATPSTGSDTLSAHYEALLQGTATDDRGDHAIF